MKIINKYAINDFEYKLKNLPKSRSDLVELAILSAIFIINIKDFKLATEDDIKEVTINKAPEETIEKALDILNNYSKEYIDNIMEALLIETSLRQQNNLERLNV